MTMTMQPIDVYMSSYLDSVYSSRVFIHNLLYLLLLYPVICLLLRHQRLRTTLKAYPYTTRASFASMTQSDAFHIQKVMSELEFPYVWAKSLQFALFRTYGIPTISSLLVDTREFSERETATKRYTDTVVLIVEFMTYHPDSQRAVEAIARMNHIHGQYIKSGKISNDDMLYTLSLFALEPIRWIDRWEWRKMEDFEKCAMGVFWKGVGDAMNIDFSELIAMRESETGWEDGLQFCDDLNAWSEKYEQRVMVPDVNNHKTAAQTVAILLWFVPSWAKHTGTKIVSVLMDDRLRTAMMYEKPSKIYFTVTNFLLTLRQYTLRYVTLPRPSWSRVQMVTDQPSKDGAFFMTSYDAAPWYVKPTIWNYYGPLTWLNRMMGLPLPGDGGDMYRPNGYRIPEIGPKSMRSGGSGFSSTEKEHVLSARSTGCPFGRINMD